MLKIIRTKGVNLRYRYLYKNVKNTDSMMIPVILVEDDNDLREMLQAELQLSGLNVDTAENALQCYKKLATNTPIVVVLDIGLPDESGLEVARYIKQKTELGLIILTALGSDKDRIEGYSAGADNYFVKPTSADELAIAIKNLAQRLAPNTHEDTIQAWHFDTINWSLSSPGGKQCTLSGKEKCFIDLVSDSGEAPITRTTLLENLNYPNNEYGQHALETLVLRLRQKILKACGGAIPLKTIRGVGYQFTARLIMD